MLKSNHHHFIWKVSTILDFITHIYQLDVVSKYIFFTLELMEFFYFFNILGSLTHNYDIPEASYHTEWYSFSLVPLLFPHNLFCIRSEIQKLSIYWIVSKSDFVVNIYAVIVLWHIFYQDNIIKCNVFFSLFTDMFDCDRKSHQQKTFRVSFIL